MTEIGAGYMVMRTGYFGIHGNEIPATKDTRTTLVWNYVAQLLYNPVLSIVKSSVLVFLLRIGVFRNKTRIAVHSVNTFNIAEAIAVFVVVIFQCTPVEYFWNKAFPGGGTCIATTTFYAWTAGLTILTDVLVLALPIWMFVGLNMATRLKVAIIGIFLMGAVVTIISCLRLRWIIERIPPAKPNPDPTYDIRYTYVFAESSLAIIAASAPVMRSLLGLWFPRAFSTNQSIECSGLPNTTSQYGYSLNESTRRGHGGIALHNWHARSKRRAEIGSQAAGASEEEIMTDEGIQRTTEVDIPHNEDSQLDIEDRWHNTGNDRARI